MCVLTVNTGTVADITVQTPGGRVDIPRRCAHRRRARSARARSRSPSATPAGSGLRFAAAERPCHRCYRRHPCTLIDNGMPVVVLPADHFGITGYESRDELNADRALASQLESIRLQGRADDEARRCRCQANPQDDAHLAPAYRRHCKHPHFHPPRLSRQHRRARRRDGRHCLCTQRIGCGRRRGNGHRAARMSIEHPSGEFTVELDLQDRHLTARKSYKAALLRTARRLFAGTVAVPQLGSGPELNAKTRNQGRSRMTAKTGIVVSAHSADFVWRAGGAIALHAEQGYHVRVDLPVIWRTRRIRKALAREGHDGGNRQARAAQGGTGCSRHSGMRSRVPRPRRLSPRHRDKDLLFTLVDHFRELHAELRALALAGRPLQFRSSARHAPGPGSAHHRSGPWP